MKQDMTIIRKARASDLPAIFSLAKNPALAAPNRQGAERWWVRDHLREQQILLVAVREKQVIGFTMGETATGKVALLHLLAVLPKYQAHGIARKLGQAFERECRQRGMTCVLTYMHHADRALDAAMRRHGYAAGSVVREYQKFL